MGSRRLEGVRETFKGRITSDAIVLFDGAEPRRDQNGQDFAEKKAFIGGLGSKMVRPQGEAVLFLPAHTQRAESLSELFPMDRLLENSAISGISGRK